MTVRRSAAMLALPLIVAVAGCQPHAGPCPRTGSDGLPACLVYASDIDARPEASLIYPGSEVLEGQTNGEELGFEGTTPASRHVLLASNGPMPTVVTWYQDALGRAGWAPATSYATATLVWSRGAPASGSQSRESFLLTAADGLDDRDQTAIPRGLGATYYAIEYRIYPARS